jgi:hypothetical protein
VRGIVARSIIGCDEDFDGGGAVGQSHGVDGAASVR